MLKTYMVAYLNGKTMILKYTTLKTKRPIAFMPILKHGVNGYPKALRSTKTMNHDLT